MTHGSWVIGPIHPGGFRRGFGPMREMSLNTKCALHQIQQPDMQEGISSVQTTSHTASAPESSHACGGWAVSQSKVFAQPRHPSSPRAQVWIGLASHLETPLGAGVQPPSLPPRGALRILGFQKVSPACSGVMSSCGSAPLAIGRWTVLNAWGIVHDRDQI